MASVKLEYSFAAADAHRAEAARSVSPRVDGRYRSIRAKEKFAKDFVAASTEVMKLDRFDHLIEAAHLSELGIGLNRFAVGGDGA